MSTPSKEASLLKVSEQLRTQDNRCTSNPMFCVQVKVRDFGYDANYASETCWRNSELDETVYTEPKDTEGWEQFGYKDRWETVMVAFTEKGCEEYLELNGHNDCRRAHNGEVRIYVESFNRCPEMIALREYLKDNLPEREQAVAEAVEAGNEAVRELTCSCCEQEGRDSRCIPCNLRDALAKLKGFSQ